ncbi:hypothetical protein C3488_27030 [Streptomyces sp. Ru72]|nr:hypothetical protein C3488_27030 [Streptomyces sp. Ru72]
MSSLMLLASETTAPAHASRIAVSEYHRPAASTGRARSRSRDTGRRPGRSQADPSSQARRGPVKR